MQEVRTESLIGSQLQDGVPEIVSALRSWGLDRVDLSYGWGCNLPMEKLWRPQQIDAAQLGAVIEQSVADGTFRFGHGDLHIEDLRRTLKFTICHESYIHFESANRQLVDEIVSRWLVRFSVLYVRTGPKGSARAAEQWRRRTAIFGR